MDKTIILTVTAIAILTFAESNNTAHAADAESKASRTECTWKRDPARKQWRSRCRTKSEEKSQSASA